MSSQVTPADRESIESIITALETAWNAGDGDAFGAVMAEDADFVTIRAEHQRGRRAIAAGHAVIFRTVFAGSKIRYTLESARPLRVSVILVHVSSILEAPTGPLAGRHEAFFSAVLTREASGWLIASFHNMLAPAPVPA